MYRHQIPSEPDQEGFTANGSWVWGRTPKNAVFELLPVGCSGPRVDVDLPTATAALSANYINASRGTRAYATVFQFVTQAQAITLIRGFAAIENSCGSSGNASKLGGATYTKRTASSVRMGLDTPMFVSRKV